LGRYQPFGRLICKLSSRGFGLSSPAFVLVTLLVCFLAFSSCLGTPSRSNLLTSFGEILDNHQWVEDAHAAGDSSLAAEALVAAHLSSDAPYGSATFAVPAELRNRVEFWKLIFSKYGKRHAVLHHRLHPHIVYSVLDFSDYMERFEGKQLKKRKQKAVDQERDRIKATLKRLESGQGTSAQEKRLFSLFQELPGSLNTNLKKAQSTKLIRWQSGIKEQFRAGLERSGRYLYAIESIFRDAGLPLELSRLPLVESSFNYEAKSNVGAAGIWQFMRATGRSYMAVDSERRDAIMATRGAVRYLKNAHNVLGNWPLALTSYNHGVGGIKRAVKKTGSKDIAVLIDRYKSKTFGFASSNFYVSFLAALEVDRNSKEYFPDLVRESPQYFDELSLKSRISYSKLKSQADFSEEELIKLNPAFLKPIKKGSRNIPAGYLLKVPKGQGAPLAGKLGATIVDLSQGTKLARAKKRSARRSVAVASSSSRHKVRPGETLGSIARKYGTSSKSIMRLNGIKNPRRLRAGQRIKIPGSGRAVAKARSGSSSKKTYRVKRGDSLYQIAKRNEVSLTSLRRLNPGLRNKIVPGQKIHLR